MRLFIAVRTTETISDKAIKLQEELSSADLKIKWVEPYNMHVTLKFLGEIDAHTTSAIENIMNAIAGKLKPFNLEFVGFGLFPNLQAPRVIWAGIGEGSDTLKTLYETLNDTLAILNIRSEQWSFSGHLTIGRIKGNQKIQGLLSKLTSIPEQSFGTMEVKSIDLMESKLTSSGPEYRILKTVELCG